MIAAAVLLHRESFSWTEWTLYPSFLIGWLLLGGAYLLCAGPLRRFFPGSRPVPPLRLASFATGMVVMLLSLQGPLHELSDYFLFSAHMVQHLLLILVMPPLLLAGVPDWMVRPALRVPGMTRLARFLTFPVVAFALNNAIFLAWHFPGPYDLMMRNHDVHVTMHTMMISAALITLADHAMYQWYVEAPRIWNLSPLEDQQQGGAIMWVPGALTLWLGITAVYFRWTHREMKEDEARGEGLNRPSRAGMVWTPPPFPERR